MLQQGDGLYCRTRAWQVLGTKRCNTDGPSPALADGCVTDGPVHADLAS